MKNYVKGFIIKLFQSREPDENGDGKADGLEFKLEMPFVDSEKVVGVKLLLFFEYTLHVSTKKDKKTNKQKIDHERNSAMNISLHIKNLQTYLLLFKEIFFIWNGILGICKL